MLHYDRINDVQCGKRVLTPYANSKGPDEHAHPMQSDQNIHCLSIYTTVSTDSVNRQLRPRLACTNAQADHVLQIA